MVSATGVLFPIGVSTTNPKGETRALEDFTNVLDELSVQVIMTNKVADVIGEVHTDNSDRVFIKDKKIRGPFPSARLQDVCPIINPKTRRARGGKCLLSNVTSHEQKIRLGTDRQF